MEPLRQPALSISSCRVCTERALYVLRADFSAAVASCRASAPPPPFTTSFCSAKRRCFCCRTARARYWSCTSIGAARKAVVARRSTHRRARRGSGSLSMYARSFPSSRANMAKGGNSMEERRDVEHVPVPDSFGGSLHTSLLTVQRHAAAAAAASADAATQTTCAICTSFSSASTVIRRPRLALKKGALEGLVAGTEGGRSVVQDLRADGHVSAGTTTGAPQ